MDDRLMFEATLTRNAARLSAVAARFIHGLSDADKDCLLGDAINLMWMRRSQFDPRHHCIGLWARDCLHDAALLRKGWRVWRHGGLQWVRGKDLEEWT